MSLCFDCKHKSANNHICDECMNGEMYERLIKTNADKIRSMSNEELSELLTKITDDSQVDSITKCNYCWEEWLEETI